jgi:Tol biopolymer transport system component
MEALDPALSPDGLQVAYVVARQSEKSDAAWYATRRLWIADIADLSDGHPVAGAGPGAALPTWSADGQVLRYSTATGVAMINSTGGRAVVISGASALTGDSGFNGETAFGKTPWPGHAVWSP